MLRKSLVLCVALVGALAAIPAQAASVQHHGKINGETGGLYTHIAPMLVANPENANHMVLAEVKRTGVRGNVDAFGTCQVSVSMDAGRSWSAPYALPTPEGTRCRRGILPQVAFGGDGVHVAYYAYPTSGVTMPGGAPSSVSGVSSRDLSAVYDEGRYGRVSAGGASFSPVGVILSARSADGGLSFAPPVALPSGLTETAYHAARMAPSVSVASVSRAHSGVSYGHDSLPRNIALAADPQSKDLWIAWAAPRYKIGMYVSRSRDGGASWGRPVFVPIPLTELATHFNPWLIYRASLAFVGNRLSLAFNWMSCPDVDPYCPIAPPSSWWFQLAYASSTDRGDTFSPAVKVGNNFKVWDYVGSLPPAPPLAVDPSNPDRMYVAYEDQTLGDVSKENYLLRSTDGGRTWSEAQRMGTNPHEDGFPHERLVLGVAPNGRVDALWYDGRNDPSSPATNCVEGDDICAGRDVMYTYSLDNGATWVPEIRITPATFEARSRRIDQATFTGQASQDSFGSIGLVSRDDGITTVWEQFSHEVTVQNSDGSVQNIPIWDLHAATVELTSRPTPVVTVL